MKRITHFIGILGFLLLLEDRINSEVLRPRGVSISRAPLYDPSKDFTCFDNSLTVPFNLVNDDYCDCPDGSDEPGTSACPTGIFHCTNAGHKPLNIVSSRVNDGICDCCDATDEYLTNKCANNCKELGRHAKEAAQRLAELVKVGKQIKAEMSAEGYKLKQYKKDKLAELEKQKYEANKVQKEKQEIKDIVESDENAALEKYRLIEEEKKRVKAELDAAQIRAEATESFTRFDSDGDGVLTIAEIQTRVIFDKDHNGEVSNEEAKYFLIDRDSVGLEEFVADVWPIVKPFVTSNSGMYKPEGDVEEVPLDNNQEPLPEEDEEGDIDGLDDIPDDDEDEEHSEATPQEEEEEEHHMDVEYDEETKILIEKATQARNEFTEADQAVRRIQTEINEIEEYLKKDFGPEESFAPLEGKCYEYTDYEYIYKICPFDKAVQQAKSGSLDTRLGTWAKWNGPQDNLYSSMLFDRGQSCWNGPQRSTVVSVSCGSENKLISVSEPNRCEYHFEFTTAAACNDNIDTSGTDDVHDEL